MEHDSSKESGDSGPAVVLAIIAGIACAIYHAYLFLYRPKEWAALQQQRNAERKLADTPVRNKPN